ncbi:hypothetical protein OK016_27365 [Vibrio chagasii]|nr:hypothetical protein [Vibrio chagasii]
MVNRFENKAPQPLGLSSLIFVTTSDGSQSPAQKQNGYGSFTDLRVFSEFYGFGSKIDVIHYQLGDFFRHHEAAENALLSVK